MAKVTKKVTDVGKEVINGVGNVAKETINTGMNIGKDALDGVSNVATEAINTGKNVGKAVKDNMKSTKK